MRDGNGQPGPTPERRDASMYGYLKAVLVDGEVPEIDADTAATLAGFVAGQRAAVLVSLHGMTVQDAAAAVLTWVAEQAALSGSLAAEGGDRG